MTVELTPADVQARLRERCEASGGRRAFGRLHGFSASYLSQVILGQKPPGDRILELIGLERLPRYTEPKAPRIKRYEGRTAPGRARTTAAG